MYKYNLADEVYFADEDSVYKCIVVGLFEDNDDFFKLGIIGKIDPYGFEAKPDNSNMSIKVCDVYEDYIYHTLGEAWYELKWREFQKATIEQDGWVLIEENYDIKN